MRELDVSVDRVGRKAVVLTDGMIRYAEQVNADKKRAMDLLKKAGLLDDNGKLAREYAA